MNLKDRIQEGMRKGVEKIKSLPTKAKEFLNNKKTEKPDKTLGKNSLKALLLSTTFAFSSFGTVKAKEYVDNNPNILSDLQSQAESALRKTEEQFNVAVSDIHFRNIKIENNSKLTEAQKKAGANYYSNYTKPGPEDNKELKLANIESEDRGIALNDLTVRALTEAGFDFNNYDIIIQEKTLQKIRDILNTDDMVLSPEKISKIREIIEEVVIPVTADNIVALASEQKPPLIITTEEAKTTIKINTNKIIDKITYRLISKLKEQSKSKERTNLQESELQNRKLENGKDTAFSLKINPDKPPTNKEKLIMTDNERIAAQVEYLLQNDQDSKPIPPFPNDKKLTVKEMIKHNEYVKRQKIIEENALERAKKMVQDNTDINKK